MSVGFTVECDKPNPDDLEEDEDINELRIQSLESIFDLRLKDFVSTPGNVPTRWDELVSVYDLDGTKGHPPKADRAHREKQFSLLDEALKRVCLEEVRESIAVPEEFRILAEHVETLSAPGLGYAIALRIFNSELSLAPVSKPHRVLNIGTGTSIWVIEFADRNPESEVLGTDLSPIQPEYVPASCSFEIDDAEDKWAFGQKLHYIHGRYMCTSIFDLPKSVGQVFDHLFPDGWVELQETVIDFKAVDASLEGTALRQWNDHILEGIRRAGRAALSLFDYASFSISAVETDNDGEGRAKLADGPGERVPGRVAKPGPSTLGAILGVMTMCPIGFKACLA
ncbi:methyltransferase domain-containing protein [Colletotrichum incanum]|uniref:Methyltransferase domain-containing protein n=1 Tax=Colletotrichum incanum TaxID=1573173 RepID=A0A167A6R0_COLIC|nr:methyltransferase domain-containing protein [Colletotrichum incanum]